MKNKLINILVIVLIILTLIPLNIFGAEYPAQDIINNFDENLSDIDTTTLENWVDILKNGKNYPSGRITVTGEEVRKQIEEEISNRKKEEEEEESWLQDIDKWKPSSDGQSHTKLTTLAGKILGAIQVVGSIASVAILSILGIKYMCASLEEKAAYKQTMILYIVGCIMVFGISNIAKIIYDFAITL